MRSWVDHDVNLRPTLRALDDNRLEKIPRDLLGDIERGARLCSCGESTSPCEVQLASKEYVRGVKLTEPVSSINRWSLDPTIAHLNHGSYGGCPHAVTLTATAWRARLEAAPMRFMMLD